MPAGSDVVVIEGGWLTVIVMLLVMVGCLTDAAMNCADPAALGVNVKELPLDGRFAGQAAPEQVQETPLFVESLLTVAAMFTDWPRSIPSELGEMDTRIEAPPPQPATTTAKKNNDIAAKYCDTRLMKRSFSDETMRSRHAAHQQRVDIKGPSFLGNEDS